MTNINQIPTYEQFTQAYIEDEQITNSYQLENESWDSEKSIGCSQSNFNKNFTAIWGAGLAGLTYICPPIGAIASDATAGAGAITGLIGKITDNDEMVDFGVDMTITGATAGFGAMAGSQGHRSSSCKVSSVCPN